MFARILLKWACGSSIVRLYGDAMVIEGIAEIEACRSRIDSIGLIDLQDRLVSYSTCWSPRYEDSNRTEAFVVDEAVLLYLNGALPLTCATVNLQPHLTGDIGGQQIGHASH